MFQFFILRSLTIASLLPPYAQAAGSESAEPIQEVQISAQRVSPLAVGNSMTSSVVVTQEEIRAKQYKTVAQAIENVPGVDVVKAGPGQTVSVFIRGQKSEQTLVLVDGIEYNDPTDPGRGVDLSNLNMDNIERIEVIRGAQSVLYPGVGSVVQIITKSGGTGESFVDLEGGSYGTAKGEIATRGSAVNHLDYAFSAGLFRTDGLSAVKGGAERDGSKTTTFSAKLTKHFENKTRTDLSLRYIDGKNDVDLVPNDTLQFKASQQSWLGRLQTSTRIGIWEPVLGINLRTIDRNSLNFGSTPNTHFNSTGDIEKVDFLNRLFLNEQHVLQIGVETERQHAKMESDYGFGPASTDRTVNQSSGLAQYDFLNDSGPLLTAGVRADYHSSFYWQPTYRVAPGWKIRSTGTTLRSAVGTGFKAPSIYQLYGEYGNASLKPEKALLLDLGLEQTILSDRALLILTFFYNKLSDLVDFDITTSKFTTIGKATTQGVELTQETRLWKWLKVSSNYTFLETKDELTGLNLLRRPRHSLSNTALFSWEDWHGTLTHQLVGQRTDLSAATFARIDMPTYNLFHFALSYKLLASTQLHVRVENLFNTQYQAIDGYSTPGLSCYAGIRQDL